MIYPLKLRRDLEDIGTTKKGNTMKRTLSEKLFDKCFMFIILLGFINLRLTELVIYKAFFLLTLATIWLVIGYKIGVTP